MKKDDIVNVLKKNDSTILSFPERGPWGDNRYRGNCSGYIQAYLIWKYQVEKLAELFAGGGTGSDVCKDMGISYVGADLNPNPVRSNILVADAVEDDVPDEFYGADMQYMHPPYSELINIPYAGSMYKDPTGELSKKDLGQMPWEEFITTLNKIVLKYFAALDKGGRMSILMGDIRRKGRFYSMLNDVVKPGEVEQVIIKAQHNVMSQGRTYSGAKAFVPIAHEYILVMKKAAPYMLDFMLPVKFTQDVRDNLKSVTWKDVVYQVMKKLGGKASLDEIYSEIDGHKKAGNNSHWKEKIRQTLQLSELFTSTERGLWQLV